MESKPVLGVIGGSGLYGMEALHNVVERQVETPFGRPSSPIFLGDIAGQRIAFLARHGIGHVYSPSEVNYRANIFALRLLGVGRVVAVSACGSLREDYAPGDIVIPDQLFDHTVARPRSFFGEGLVAHVSVADPFCSELSDHLARSVSATGAMLHRGGTSITIEGPRFSTRAESNTYRAWGMSLVGMTTAPEAFLAKEAEMCYSVMAHVTDYDVWHMSEEPVTVEMVVRVLEANTRIAQEAIAHLIQHMPSERSCRCGHALQSALITRREHVSAETRRKLAPLVDRTIP